MKIGNLISSVAFRLVVAAGLTIPAAGWAQSASVSDDTEAAPARARVQEVVDENRLATLQGNTHPLARPAHDRGRVESSRLMERMVLVLQRSPEQQKALDAFNERQQDPASPDFHRWLEPEEFGRAYGPSDSDMAAVISWLRQRSPSRSEAPIRPTSSISQPVERRWRLRQAALSTLRFNHSRQAHPRQR